ncbi:MAG: prealbumin-like fold domain-containing protein, partial [Methanimicrococcus sp.]|nr:prealbumin-like fold domain-containing protein [Methanimicrococcus sp.]
QSVIVQADTAVTVRAAGASGYAFSYWTGISTLENPYTFDVDGDYTIGAVFCSEGGGSYTLTPSPVTNGDVYIKVGSGSETEFTDVVKVAAGTDIVIRAAGDSGYDFSYWTGIRALDNPHAFKANADYTIGAVFYNESEDFFTLTPSAVSNGIIYIKAGSGLETEFTQSVTVAANIGITIRALGDSGYVFSYWTGISAIDNPYSFEADDDYTIGAVFSLPDEDQPYPGHQVGFATIRENSSEGGGFTEIPSGNESENSAVLVLRVVDGRNPAKTLDATFEILNEKGDVKVYSTNRGATEKIILEPGIYRLFEVKAPAGYIASDGPIDIVVNDDLSIRKIDGLTGDSEHEGVYELVIKYTQESKDISTVIYIILIVISLLAVIPVVYKKFRNKRK